MPNQYRSGDKFRDISAIDSRLAELEQEKQQLIAPREELQIQALVLEMVWPVSELLQSTRSSSALIPCRHRFSFHGIDVFCLARRNKYHEKYH